MQSGSLFAMLRDYHSWAGPPLWVRIIESRSLGERACDLHDCKARTPLVRVDFSEGYQFKPILLAFPLSLRLLKPGAQCFIARTSRHMRPDVINRHHGASTLQLNQITKFKLICHVISSRKKLIPCSRM